LTQPTSIFTARWSPSSVASRRFRTPGHALGEENREDLRVVTRLGPPLGGGKRCHHQGWWLAVVVVCAVTFSTTLATGAQVANDPGLSKQWGMRLIGAPTAWATATGHGVTIAVVDTGVDLHHEDLVTKLVPGYNVVHHDQPPQDDAGHGTHVAGIAAAATGNGKGVVGVAPDATIMPVKALDNHGTGSAQSITEGIEWAVDHGAQIINLSLGAELQGVFGPSFSTAIEYAWAKGAICVVAAGNSFLLSSGFTNQHAVVVGAVGPEDRKPLYASTVGPAMWGISAPGGMADGVDAHDVLSTYPGNQYAYMAGTSMAAPHIAGALAILRSLGLSPADAITRLLTTATDLGDHYTYGVGRLDLAKAVSGLSAATAGRAVTDRAVSNPTTEAAAQARAATAGGGPGAALAPAVPSRSPQPGPAVARPVASNQLASHGHRGIPGPTAAVAIIALIAVAYATYSTFAPRSASR
jgi:subtilisin family serine protease